jgi:hypothetical protein
VALPVANTLEGGSNGTTVSGANSGGASGTALDDVLTATGGTLAYDSTVTHPGHGSLVLKTATSTTAGNSYAGWTNTTTGTGSGAFSGRFYFQIGAVGSPASYRIYSCSTVAAGTICFTMILTTSTRIVNVNGTGGTNIGSAGSALATGTWYRVEFQCTPSTTVGQVKVQFYADDSATLVTSIDTGATQNLGGTGLFGAVRFGFSGTTVASAGPLYYDDMAIVAGSVALGPSIPPARAIRPTLQAVNRSTVF